MNDWRWSGIRDFGHGKPILPPEQEKTLGELEAKRQKSNELFGQLRGKLAHRPEMQQRLADLGQKMAHSTRLIAELRHVMEFRHELKRMALQPEQVKALLPARSTPWGQRPLFVIGLRDTEGRDHLFQRPIRVPQA
jgi:uncharacterized protein YecE (DUF72 family)